MITKVLGVLSKFFHKNEFKRLESARSLLKEILVCLNDIYDIPTEKRNIDSLFLLGNRMYIDSAAVSELVSKGYYGSAYTLVASMYRTLRMHIALLLRPELAQKYFDEESETYQSDKRFKSTFGEGDLYIEISKKLGKDVGIFTEIEKLNHGSGFAIRKYYSKKEKINGLRTPIIVMGKFYEPLSVSACLGIAEAAILDFIGIYLQERGETDIDKETHEKFLKKYFKLMSVIKEQYSLHM